MEILEEVSRLKLAGGESMVASIRRPRPKTPKLLRADRIPSGLVGVDGKPIR